MVDPLEESGMDPVDDLACFSHLKSSIGNASSYFIHYICNESTPYPTMTLKRATWSAVCLLYTLPSMTMCYYKEDEGRCLKITQGEEYTVTSTPYTQLLTTGKQDVMEMYSTSMALNGIIKRTGTTCWSAYPEKGYAFIRYFI